MMEKIILITGASRGIGAATALLAAKNEYTVCVNFLTNVNAAQKIIKQIEAEGGKAFAAQGDIAKEEDVLKIFSSIDQYTQGTLVALVNNAGILEKQSALKDFSIDRLQRVFATNVFGSFLCAREAVRRMSTKSGGKGGAIVNVSTTATKHGAAGEYVDYAASKGAIDVMTFGLSKEVAAEGIRVNAVRPGIIDTEIHASGGEPNRVERIKDMIPMKRAGKPEEVANTILWLLSDEASYLTGTLVDISGGR
jgi:NAD(P)-dependent dehydrogenase (short-subunit alcohol dehydrogenase family)